jgi:hypothetical protein
LRYLIPPDKKNPLSRERHSTTYPFFSSPAILALAASDGVFVPSYLTRFTSPRQKHSIVLQFYLYTGNLHELYIIKSNRSVSLSGDYAFLCVENHYIFLYILHKYSVLKYYFNFILRKYTII